MGMFFSLIEGQILREFQNIEKFVSSCKKHDFTKGMHSYIFSNFLCPG